MIIKKVAMLFLLSANFFVVHGMENSDELDVKQEKCTEDQNRRILLQEACILRIKAIENVYLEDTSKIIDDNFEKVEQRIHELMAKYEQHDHQEKLTVVKKGLTQFGKQSTELVTKMGQLLQTRYDDLKQSGVMSEQLLDMKLESNQTISSILDRIGKRIDDLEKDLQQRAQADIQQAGQDRIDEIMKNERIERTTLTVREDD